MKGSFGSPMVKRMWYKAYGWSENPFSIKPNPRLVGLEHLQEKVLEKALSGIPSLILGETGVGKTSLLLWLLEKLEENGTRPIYVNLHRLPPPRAPSLQLELLRHRTLLERLLRRFPKKVILLLDEAQELDQETAQLLKAHYDSDHLLSFVFASCEEPKLPPPLRARIGPNLHRLGRLPLVQGINLVKHRTKGKHPFENDDVIAEIVKRADFSPRRILQLCEYVCISFRAKAEIGEPITRTDLLGLLDQGEPFPREEGLPEPSEPNEPANRAKRAEEDGKALLDGLSPLQQEIVRLLMEGPKTTEELHAKLGSPRDSIRKRLSQLRSPKNGFPPLVEIVSDRIPKRYGLTAWAKDRLKASS